MCVHALAGERAQAQVINQQLQGLNDSLFVEANPIAVKWCLAQMKLLNDGFLRLPLVELSSSYHEQLLNAMKQARVL